MRAGLVGADADIAVGDVLGSGVRRSADDITIADLTGIGAVDAAVASRVVSALLG